MGQAWFLAQIKPNCVAIATRHLARQGFETFLPLEETSSRSGTKFVTSTRPLFPGYIFVAFDPIHGHWRAINSTQGITRLVGFGGEPTPVPAHVIGGLKRLCSAENVLEHANADRLKAGDRARVLSGAFTDLIVTILHEAPNKRAWILIDIMGGSKNALLDKNKLRAI